MTQKYLIAGEWQTGETDIENCNPSDLSDLAGHFEQASSAQLDKTLDRAWAAQVEWAAYGPERKQNALNAIGSELTARAEELGTLLSREEGKPWAEDRGDVVSVGQFFTYYQAKCLRQLGENADSVCPDIEIDARREPVGTVAIISPWKFPTATASWKTAPVFLPAQIRFWLKPAANLARPCQSDPAPRLQMGTGHRWTISLKKSTRRIPRTPVSGVPVRG